MRAISAGDMKRSQRWAAEFVCSDLGLGRLEALLYHIWALYVGGVQAPGWPSLWYKNIQHMRTIWGRSGGDIRVVRNTPSVRQSVAECVAWLVLASKKPLPVMPKSEDCFREAEAMRARLRAGGGSGDQASTRRIWDTKHDGHDLKTIGNEFEAALRTNQISRMLFWIVWLQTLDSLKECPPVKERGPPGLTKKQQKSVLWFLVAVLDDLISETRAYTPEEGKAILNLLHMTWPKLSTKAKRDILASISISIQDRCQKSLSLTAPPTPAPPTAGMRAAMSDIDAIYAEIADEAKRFVSETPKITELTAEAAAMATAQANTRALPTSFDKLSLAFHIAGGK